MLPAGIAKSHRRDVESFSSIRDGVELVKRQRQPDGSLAPPQNLLSIMTDSTSKNAPKSTISHALPSLVWENVAVLLSMAFSALY
jgi:hypothetical protein